MKRKTIGIGAEDFKEIIEENNYYIDKTLFIQEILETGAKVTLITRPRRFGKTLNMSTLKYFLDIRDAEKNRELFRGLNIEKTESMSEQGKYPVIHLTMKEIKGINYEDFYKDFKFKVSNLYDKYKYVRESLDERSLDSFDKIWWSKEEADYKGALLILSEILYEYHGIKPVILIDEYDAPMLEAHEQGYYEEVQKLIGAFYGNALKGGCSSFAIVTGILKVAKESLFSTLNNLKVSTIFSGDYNYFGMTEEEVVEILKYYNWETTLEDTKKWYNGYLFGEERVYNPWSITHHCEHGKLEAFWVGTSANLLIKKILKNADEEIMETMYSLVRDGRVLTRLEDSMVFGEKDYNSDILMYIMISGGYLTIESRGESSDEYYLTIPNYEVREYFGKTFKKISAGNSLNSFSKLEKALVNGEIEGIEGIRTIIERIFEKSISYLDLGDGERFYHNIVLSMVSGIDSKFYAHSNRESGLGRYDLAIEPKDRKGTGYIFEFKAVPKKDRVRIERATTWENEDEQEAKLQGMMDRLGEEALVQIDRKIYDSDMKSRGIEKIIKIGMVFCGKQLQLYTK